MTLCLAVETLQVGSVEGHHAGGMSTKPPVRIRDIAERIGVSKVTVSLALRDHPRISLERRKQVRQVADEMGYRPDAMATALAHRKWASRSAPVSAALAWINHWPQPEQLRSYREFDGYWRGAHTAAEERGFRLEEFVWNEDFTIRRLQRIFAARNIRGVLIPPHAEIVMDWTGFRWENFAAIRFGRSVKTPPMHQISNSHVSDALMAVGRMQSLGYRRIGYVSSARFERVTLFGAGFLRANVDIPSENRIPPLVLQKLPIEANRDDLACWLKEFRPDAILTSVAELRGMLDRAEVRVPEDIGLAGTSVLDAGVDAGIFQNPEEIGRAAVETLISLLYNNHFGIPEFPREIQVRGTWVDGTTLPPR